MLNRNALCTITFISVTCLIAIVYPNVSDVLGILGGLNATAIQFLVPSNILKNFNIYSALLCQSKWRKVFITNEFGKNNLLRSALSNWIYQCLHNHLQNCYTLRCHRKRLNLLIWAFHIFIYQLDWYNN
jgi:hypothetical protein